MEQCQYGYKFEFNCTEVLPSFSLCTPPDDIAGSHSVLLTNSSGALGLDCVDH